MAATERARKRPGRSNPPEARRWSGLQPPPLGSCQLVDEAVDDDWIDGLEPVGSEPILGGSCVRPGAEVILVCDGGYQSSLAAATLQQLGFDKATDLMGGFQAWKAAGLPTVPAEC